MVSDENEEFTTVTAHSMVSFLDGAKNASVDNRPKWLW